MFEEVWSQWHPERERELISCAARSIDFVAFVSSFFCQISWFCFVLPYVLFVLVVSKLPFFQITTVARKKWIHALLIIDRQWFFCSRASNVIKQIRAIIDRALPFFDPGPNDFDLKKKAEEWVRIFLLAHRTRYHTFKLFLYSRLPHCKQHNLPTVVASN